MTTIATYFTLPPNWAEGVKYARAWRTSIISAATGEEQRAALFTWPRRSLEYSVAGMTSAETNYIKRKFFKGQGTVYGVPLWTSRTTLYEEAASGQPLIRADYIAGHEFEEGMELILLGSTPDMYEVGSGDNHNRNRRNRQPNQPVVNDNRCGPGGHLGGRDVRLPGAALPYPE